MEIIKRRSKAGPVARFYERGSQIYERSELGEQLEGSSVR